MWVSDLTRTHIFAYRLDEGTRQRSLDVDLHPDSAAPRGLTGGVNLLWAADNDDEKAYAYLVPNQAPEFDQETV